MGDFDRDGSANANDISPLLSAFTDLTGYQASHQISDGDLLAIGDIDQSGAVDNRDIGLLLNYISVPEPATIVLFIIGLAILVAAGKTYPISDKARGSRRVV